MVQEHWQQLKMKFYQVITWKSLFSGEDLSKRRKMSIFLANHVQILSWKPLPLIYLSATSRWFLKEENFYPNKFLQTMDNVFPTVNENKSLLWNYSYSDKSRFFKIWILLLQFLRQQSIYWILHNGPIAKMLSKYSHQFAKSIYFIWLLG